MKRNASFYFLFFSFLSSLFSSLLFSFFFGLKYDVPFDSFLAHHCFFVIWFAMDGIMITIGKEDKRTMKIDIQDSIN